jgi:hypothetical protein
MSAAQVAKTTGFGPFGVNFAKEASASKVNAKARCRLGLKNSRLTVELSVRWTSRIQRRHAAVLTMTKERIA